MTQLPDPYLYDIPSGRDPNLNLDRLETKSFLRDAIPLTGWVHGLEASDLEERYARGLKASELDFSFRVKIPVMTLQKKEIDFLVYKGTKWPVETDGPMGHTTSAQKGFDDLREALLSPIFWALGWMPLKRVKFWQLDNQDEADRVVREMFV